MKTIFKYTLTFITILSIPMSQVIADTITTHIMSPTDVVTLNSSTSFIAGLDDISGSLPSPLPSPFSLHIDGGTSTGGGGFATGFSVPEPSSSCTRNVLSATIKTTLDATTNPGNSGWAVGVLNSTQDSFYDQGLWTHSSPPSPGPGPDELIFGFQTIGTGVQEFATYTFANPTSWEDIIFAYGIEDPGTGETHDYINNIEFFVEDTCSKPSQSSSSKSNPSRIRYTCNDIKATNYNKFGRHKASLCTYNTETQPESPVITETMDNTLEDLLSDKTCSYFTQHMRKGDRDGQTGQEKQEAGVSQVIDEVSFLQSVLNALGYNAGPIDGIFGTQTHNGVSQFQQAHFKTVLQPWNLSGPTGRFYQSTRVRTNEVLGCDDEQTLDNGEYLN